jgi:hypothetical protein
MTPTDITPPLLYITYNDHILGPHPSESACDALATCLSSDSHEALQHNLDNSIARLWFDGEVMLEGSTAHIMKELGRV